MKKKTIIASCIGTALLLAGGIAFGINRYQYSKNIIDVIPVEMLSSDWGFEQEGNSGMVTNSMSQEIVPDEEQTVKKIYVKEGQKVKIGDKILSYDMAKKKLDLELKGYDVKEIEFSIKRAEKELSDLKKGKVSGGGGYGTSLGRRDPFLASLFLRSSETNSADATNEAATGTESTTEDTASTTTVPENTTENSGTTEEGQEPATTYYEVLDENSEPYKAEKGYYYYLCSGDDCIIKGSFINMIKEKNHNVVLQISVNGEIKNVLTLYASQEDKKNPKQEWRLDSYQTDVEVEDPSGPDDTTSDGSGDPGTGDGGSFPSGDDIGGGDITYTKEEIKAMIAEKETDLADLKLDLREAKLEYDTMEKEVKDGTVTAVINGIVKEVRDPDEAAAEGAAVVTVSSEGNLYVKGTVDEFSYGSLKKGAMVTANSWETGSTFQAKVTDISPYPVSNGGNYGYGYGTGNPNVSYYPFTAVIEEPPEEISSGESVTLSFNKNEPANTEGAIYLPLAYVRTENNESYVYVQGKDKKLEKRYVKTGQTLYNYVIEIKSGIKISDNIAFPYGKTVKEGAKTKAADDESDIIY